MYNDIINKLNSIIDEGLVGESITCQEVEDELVIYVSGIAILVERVGLNDHYKVEINTSNLPTMLKFYYNRATVEQLINFVIYIENNFKHI